MAEVYARTPLISAVPVFPGIFPVIATKFPVMRKRFPVIFRGEFVPKLLNCLQIWSNFQPGNPQGSAL
jgi:hypothetical protein